MSGGPNGPHPYIIIILFTKTKAVLIPKFLIPILMNGVRMY